MDGERRAATVILARGYKRPRRYWLERAREAGAAKVGNRIHEMVRLGLGVQATADSAYDDWIHDVEWWRPSAFRACLRVERLLRTPFVEAFAAEVQEWMSDEPCALRFERGEP